jgi:hypothetical protein
MQSVLAPLIGPKVCVPPSLKGRTALVTGGFVIRFIPIIAAATPTRILR